MVKAMLLFPMESNNEQKVVTVISTTLLIVIPSKARNLFYSLRTGSGKNLTLAEVEPLLEV